MPTTCQSLVFFLLQVLLTLSISEPRAQQAYAAVPAYCRVFPFLAHENVELLFGFCSSLLGLLGLEQEMLRICSQYHLMREVWKETKVKCDYR